MKTLKDFLEWYNNLDISPFIEAVEKMREFYRLKRLDIFKDGVSLPGLVLKYLIKSTDSEFYLFDDEDKINVEIIYYIVACFVFVFLLCLIRLMNSKVLSLDLGYIMLNLIITCPYVVTGGIITI
jgi:hypothetical protein